MLSLRNVFSILGVGGCGRGNATTADGPDGTTPPFLGFAMAMLDTIDCRARPSCLESATQFDDQWRSAMSGTYLTPAAACVPGRPTAQHLSLIAYFFTIYASFFSQRMNKPSEPPPSTLSGLWPFARRNDGHTTKGSDPTGRLYNPGTTGENGGAPQHSIRLGGMRLDAFSRQNTFFFLLHFLTWRDAVSTARSMSWGLYRDRRRMDGWMAFALTTNKGTTA